MGKTMKRYFAIFVLPTLIAFFIAFVIPFVMGLYLSFCDFTTVTNATFVGFSNYIKAFTNQDFLNALWFTVKFAAVAVITINVCGFILALMLTQKIKGTNIFRTVFFMPNLIGGIVLGYIWQSMINGVLSQIGVTMLMDPSYGYWGMIILMNWQLIGYIMIIYIAGLQNVSTDILEAARIDGAGKLQTLTRVTIPMVMPSITICLFLSIANSFKMFDQNLALTGGGPSNKTAMLALDIFNTFYGKVGFEGVGQAKAVVFFIIVAGIAMTQLAFTRKKEVES
ncbi:ABC transporter permease [Clostridium sp. chh4-2]|uniref:carbohydrate ABC transporter permease n=1 Tax=Clostridium sp. chh4-2 TaxID=2067550 RepID=UPI000CCE038D|nr:sugar ABC transporter permease [Clostridium sp. chh4-2]PNV60966.1 ABC transporter permease [Clostridium sp. chh4-2]